jgi:hypothetical protein
MRTNVNIADDARNFAEIYAHANGISLGDAITELIRKSQYLPPAEHERPQFARNEAGFPILPPPYRVLTTEMVRKAETDDFD